MSKSQTKMHKHAHGHAKKEKITLHLEIRGFTKSINSCDKNLVVALLKVINQ